MKQRGFTILELIIAIGIMGAAALIGVPSLSGVQTRSELKSDKLTGSQIGQAMLIKNLEDGNANSYLNQQIKYEDISNIDVYVSSGYTPLVMQNGYYVVSQVKVDGKIVLMVGVTKEGQIIEKTSIYDGKIPGWVWCQAGEIEKFLKESGDKIVIEDETPVEETKIYRITATATTNGKITPSGEIEVMSGKNAVFVSEERIDKENVVYVFKNWQIDGETVEDEGNDNIYTFQNVQANRTIKAVYEEKDKYQLTVDLDGIITMNTNILPGQEVKIGSNANSYTVTGIDSQSAGTFRFEMPTDNVKISGNYAELETSSYIITYNANGGTGTMSTQAVTAGGTASLSINTFTKSKYTFLGWSTSATTTTATYTNGQTITPTADITLYAVWGAACNHEATTKAYETLLDDGSWYETHEVIETCNICNAIVSREEEACDIEYGDYWDDGSGLCAYDYWCTECGYSNGGFMDHIWEWSYIETEATCLSSGVDIYQCMNCGSTYPEYTVTDCYYDYSNELSRTEPTCGDDGEVIYGCIWCGATYREVIPALGHNYDMYSICTRCNQADPDAWVGPHYCEYCGSTGCFGECTCSTCGRFVEECECCEYCGSYPCADDCTGGMLRCEYCEELGCDGSCQEPCPFCQTPGCNSCVGVGASGWQ